MKFFKLCFFILFCIGPFTSTYSQTTRILGKITDAKTKEPIPFVNVFFKEKNIGTTTDFEGSFVLETKFPCDTIVTSLVGYNSRRIKIQRGKFQELHIKLESGAYALHEVVIQYDHNPADVLMKKVIGHKEENDLKGLDAYQYEVYNKIQFDANNITEKFMNKRVLRPFKFIFNNMDTSTLNGKTYLPVFITEAISDVYFRKSPKTTIEKIKGSKVSGIEDQSITQFLGDMYQKVNVYDNYITLFNKNFMSPASDFGSMFYRYYLTDSTYIDNQWCFKIMFKPKRKQELTFTGELWIHDTSFAVKEVDMKAAEDANINFIDNLAIKQRYAKTDQGKWMIAKDQLIVDFNIILNTRKTLGLYGRKTSSYKKYVFNQLQPPSFYNEPANIILDEDATHRDEAFWHRMRHDSLSKSEKSIYVMVDSVKSLPVFRTYVDIIRIIFTGYKRFKYIEIGPYISLYSSNAIEGSRFKMGIRSSNEFSKKVRYTGYLAYGTRDETYKYGLGMQYMFNKNPRKSFAFNYKFDTEQLGQSQTAFKEDNFIASLLRRSPSNKLTLVYETNADYEHEWYNGFSNTLHLTYRKIFPIGNSKFALTKKNSVIYKPSIITSEIRLDTRLAFNEKFMVGAFNRTSLGTLSPILELKYTLGLSGIFNSDYNYHKLQLGVRQRFNVGPLGWTKYIIEGGKIWGKLPYPLLKLHEANETYSFDEYSFNLMNYYEFVSDQYASVYLTHHFDGYFLNRIPLLRKLKWREVLYGKAVVGTLEKRNREYSFLPDNMYTLEHPYYEAGVGIENILTLLRVDCLWRLSHLDHKNAPKYTLMATIVLSF